MRVREDDIVRPDGTPGIYGVVETRIATAAVPLTPGHEVYLVGQYRYPTDRYSWEVPQGGTDPDEAPLAAIQRELKEEAGLIASSWEPLGSEIHLSNCISSEIGFIYLAEHLHEAEPDPDGTEILEVRKVPFAQCLQMAHSGEIQDAMTLLALFYAERHLKLRD